MFGLFDLVLLENSQMDEGVSGSVGGLSFTFFPNLLGLRGGVRVHGAGADGGCTASEHVVRYASVVRVELGARRSLGGCLGWDCWDGQAVLQRGWGAMGCSEVWAESEERGFPFA